MSVQDRGEFSAILLGEEKKFFSVVLPEKEKESYFPERVLTLQRGQAHQIIRYFLYGY